MYQHLKLKGNQSTDNLWTAIEELRERRKRKSFEGELKKIEELCKEFKIPDPEELYVIPRDLEYSNVTQFDQTMPDGLARWIDEAEFEYTMSQINQYLQEAEKIDCRTVWNGICKYLTCFMIRACQRSRMERAIIRIRNFILSQNEDIYHAKGFHIVEPGARGMRHIEFRSITYYSMKYFLENEEKIPITEDESARFRNAERSSMGLSLSLVIPKRKVSARFNRPIKK